MTITFASAAASVGPVGLLAVFVVAILKGKLVPRATLEDVIRDRDQWRAAHELSETARGESAGQVETLLEYARTTDAFIRALPGQPHPPRRT